MAPISAIRAESREDLKTLTGWIHDCWFDLDALVHDPDTGTVTLPLRRPRERSGLRGDRGDGPPAGVLSVARVLGVEVHDDADVGTYDVDEIVVGDDADLVVELRSNIPLQVRFRVGAIDVLYRDASA